MPSNLNAEENFVRQLIIFLTQSIILKVFISSKILKFYKAWLSNGAVSPTPNVDTSAVFLLFMIKN
jgi:hypothetical protein